MVNILNDKKYVIIDDLLPEQFTDYIEQRVINNRAFPWYAAFLDMGYATVNPESLSKYGNIVHEGPQLCHIVIWDSKVKSPSEVFMLQSISTALRSKFGLSNVNIIRAKYNLQLQLTGNKEGLMNGPHIDDSQNHLVLIYYVNDSDGETRLFENENLDIMVSVKPKKGRVIIFDGSVLHTGQHPIDSQLRCILNVNLIL
jgi:hypothetical protein